MDMTFRRQADGDLPTLLRWLNEPGVVRWWEDDDVSWEGVVRDYGSASTDHAEHWIASADGRYVGWIQCFATVDEPDEAGPWWALGVDRTAAGIDYLVENARFRFAGVVEDRAGPGPSSWPTARRPPGTDEFCLWTGLQRRATTRLAE